MSETMKKIKESEDSLKSLILLFKEEVSGKREVGDKKLDDIEARLAALEARVLLVEEKNGTDI